jgi:hypothetical protein
MSYRGSAIAVSVFDIMKPNLSVTEAVAVWFKASGGKISLDRLMRLYYARFHHEPGMSFYNALEENQRTIRDGMVY